MAIARSLAAFVLALVGGLLMIKLSPIFYQSDYQPGSDQAKQTRTFSSELLHSAIYMGKYFSITLLLSAVVRALVPPEMVTRLLGGDTKTGTLLAIGMGIPFYTCGGSAIPFMQSLMELGMNKGATLAFFLAGPATKLETLYAYKRMLGGKVLAFFLLLTMLFSYIAGLIYAWL
jgi:uncharacterized membrane protein YraQ (UPF0718 family)